MPSLDCVRGVSWGPWGRLADNDDEANALRELAVAAAAWGLSAVDIEVGAV